MKKILITGGTSGIGQAALHKLSIENEVIFTYYKSNEKSKELTNKYKNTISYPLDLSNKSSIEELVSKIDNLDVLINNAAISDDDDLFLKTYESFSNTVNTNLTGTFYLTKLLSKKMKDNKSGTIIFISSNNSINNNYPESIDYDASKCGINSLVYNFADYLAPYVKVIGIAPGWVNTRMNESLTKDFKEKECNKILLKRFAQPEEIANLIEFLISDKASYINKTIIRIDGGIK